MAEVRLPEKELYPNNSDVAKSRVRREEDRQERQERKAPAKVVKGELRKRKRPIGKRIAEIFGAHEGQGIIDYVLTEIIVPATKNMLLDSIMDGAEMAFFGEVRGRRGRGRYGDSRYRYDYDRVSYRNDDRRTRYSRTDDRDRDRDRDPRDDRREMRRMRDYEDFIFRTVEDAEEVIGCLGSRIDEYGDATVSDLYEYMGISSEYQFRNYGWEDIRGARAVRVREGYILDLPRPILLTR